MNKPSKSKPYVVLVAPEENMKDGVAQYIKQLSLAMKRTNTDVITKTFNFHGFFRTVAFIKNTLKESEIFHLQYPMEYWGNSINPGIALFIGYIQTALRKRAKIVLTLHEWNSMHILRKISIIPLLWSVDSIVFVSPSEKRNFHSSLLGLLAGGKVKPSYVIPIGINLQFDPIDKCQITTLRNKITKNDEKCIVIGFFGFIYEWKQPYKLLNIIAEYKKKGINAKLIIAGDFPEDHKNEKQRFEERIKDLNIQDLIQWEGYIEDEGKIAELLSTCNVVTALYEDGLTARRGSFWYLVELGTPIITTSPSNNNEFTEKVMNKLLTCSVTFVEPSASHKQLAELIIKQYPEYNLPKPKTDIAPTWKDISMQHLDLFSELASK
jgi:glycosyltransferase involved in cell wall biosynthesis